MPPAGQGGRLIHLVIARAIIVGVFFEKECLPRRALRWRSDRIRPEPLLTPRGVIAPARFILHRTRMDATTSSPAVKPVCPARHIRHSSAIRIEKTARHQPAG